MTARLIGIVKEEIYFYTVISGYTACYITSRANRENLCIVSNSFLYCYVMVYREPPGSLCFVVLYVYCSASI